MKRIARYVWCVVAVLVAGLALVNIPELARAMLDTLTKISWQIWCTFILGMILGSFATGFAMKPKKVLIEDDNSVDM